MQLTISTPIYDSFRVRQISGMFDVPLTESVSETFTVDELPQDENWQIGLIVGPSGSGKSTIAKHVFGEQLYQDGDWPENKAVVDCFGEMSIRDITYLLTSVGFSSPPSWVKPYHVLSNGEKFRCDLARALSVSVSDGACSRVCVSDRTSVPVLYNVSDGACPRATTTVVFDEFTSVVDRNVAKIGSAAIAKGIKTGKMPCRFVAVTCHYDVTEWLTPDWVLDMATKTVTRRSLRRPPIHLCIVRCSRHAWEVFKRHHYLSAELPQGTRCYMALWNNEPVAFCAMIPMFGKTNYWRISRIVTLPDYQGISIGSKFLKAMAQIYMETGNRVGITTSHPAMIGHCKNSEFWTTKSVKKSGQRKAKAGDYQGSIGRAVVSFEFTKTR